MVPIAWDRFSWEAFATLVTGLSAVGAATIVGLRQMGIAKQQVAIDDRQSRILAKQAHLEELRLRTELFERRLAIYQATHEFLAGIMRDADQPEKAIEFKFLSAIDQSKFLFRDKVHQDLEEIWKKSCGFFAIKSAMKQKYQATGDYGSENIEKEHEFLTWLNAALGNLSDLFGDEAKLSTPIPT